MRSIGFTVENWEAKQVQMVILSPKNCYFLGILSILMISREPYELLSSGTSCLKENFLDYRLILIKLPICAKKYNLQLKTQSRSNEVVPVPRQYFQLFSRCRRDARVIFLPDIALFKAHRLILNLSI